MRIFLCALSPAQAGKPAIRNSAQFSNLKNLIQIRLASVEADLENCSKISAPPVELATAEALDTIDLVKDPASHAVLFDSDALLASRIDVFVEKASQFLRLQSSQSEPKNAEPVNKAELAEDNPQDGGGNQSD
jgi:hypothetical protein